MPRATWRRRSTRWHAGIRSCPGYAHRKARLVGDWRGAGARHDRLGRLRLQFPNRRGRSEEHTSELQSLMRISYAVFCLKKKKTPPKTQSQVKERNKEVKHSYIKTINYVK